MIEKLVSLLDLIDDQICEAYDQEEVHTWSVLCELERQVRQLFIEELERPERSKECVYGGPSI